eukprot:TRINITY_DN5412_c0_g1_i1.p1 TRINITY_DN5412_c0_g1~~TRINITY_DN5412_c0_g1_i1.p1  ORF type:complete len:562 (+),score=110.23 TRINITY_DN5412_c0_g1_i1:144-1829(+)
MKKRGLMTSKNRQITKVSSLPDINISKKIKRNRSTSEINLKKTNNNNDNDFNGWKEKKGSGSKMAKGALHIGISDEIDKKKNLKVSKIKKLKTEQLLATNPVAILALLNTVVDLNNETVGIALADLFCTSTDALFLSDYAIEQEINKVEDETQILRGSGVLIRLLSSIGVAAGSNVLKTLIQPLINKIVEEKLQFETNINKVSEQESENNLRCLKETVNELIENIEEQIVDIPFIMLYICNSIYEIVENKFPGYGKRSLVSYIILRFVTPAITLPSKYHIVDKCSIDLTRKLIIIGKAFQVLYNEAYKNNNQNCFLSSELAGFYQDHDGCVDNVANIILEKYQSILNNSTNIVLQTLFTPFGPQKKDLKKAKSHLQSYIMTNIDDFTEQNSLLTNEYFEENDDGKINLFIQSYLNHYKFINGIEIDLNVENWFYHFTEWLSSLKVSKNIVHDERVYARQLETFSEEYDSCLVKIKEPNGVEHKFVFAKEEFSPDSFQRKLQSEFSTIKSVFYEKDGKYLQLKKKTFDDFMVSCEVKNKKRHYQLTLYRKATPALDNFMMKL